MRKVLLILPTFILLLAPIQVGCVAPNAALDIEYSEKIEGSLYEFMDSDELVPIMVKLDPALTEEPRAELIATRDAHTIGIDLVRNAMKARHKKYDTGQKYSEDDQNALDSLAADLDDKRNERAWAIGARENELSEILAQSIRKIVEASDGRITHDLGAVSGVIFARIPGSAIAELAEHPDVDNVYHNPLINIVLEWPVLQKLIQIE